MSRGKRSRKGTYPNGQAIVTPQNYRQRLWQLPLALREEALQMMKKRKLDREQEWEAVEAVVSGATQAKRDERPPLWERVDYRRHYGG